MLLKIVSLLIRKKGKFLFATSLHFLVVLERKEKGKKKHFGVTKILSDLFSWTGQRSRGDTQKAPLPATLRARIVNKSWVVILVLIPDKTFFLLP